MEINAEINKVFGEEMAKLFASQISEEELEKVSRESWNKITERPIRWRDKEPSMLDEMLRTELINKLLSKAQDIMREETPEEFIQKEAERIVKDAKEKSHELIVNTIAEHIEHAVFNNYNLEYEIGNGCNKIAQAIFETRR